MVDADDKDNQGQPRGKWSFIFTQGVLGWGIPFFVLMVVWDRWQLGHWPPAMQMASLGCLSAFGGYVLGAWLWREKPKK